MKPERRDTSPTMTLPSTQKKVETEKPLARQISVQPSWSRINEVLVAPGADLSRTTPPAVARPLTQQKTEADKPPQRHTPSPPPWSRANQVLSAQSDHDNSSSDNDSPYMMKLYSRIPHMIERVKIGRMPEEEISTVSRNCSYVPDDRLIALALASYTVESKTISDRAMV